LTAEGLANCANTTDCLAITINHTPTVFADDDAVICESEVLPLTGTAENYTGVLWETNGDGTFEQDDQLSTVYTPGPGDIQSGGAELCLTASALQGCDDVQDCMALIIWQEPIAIAGDDLSACEGMPVTLNGQASNWVSVVWTTNGDGTFDNPGNLMSVYNPGVNDITAGYVELCLTALGYGICENDQDCMEVFISKAPSVYAGLNTSICETDILLVDGFAKNYTSSLWETSGDGYFEEPEQLVTNYIPGANDIQNGSVELCLNAYAYDGCDDVQACISLSIYHQPTANTGDDKTTCGNEPVVFTGQALNAQSVTWSTSGDGTFSDPTKLEVEYAPGPGDLATGVVDLCLKATGYGSCGIIVDCMTLSFVPAPIVFAGDDIEICEFEPLVVSGNATNYASLLWETSGDGTFENPDQLESIYNPGINDVLSGEVTLCLSAIAFSGCIDITDCLSLIIIQAPYAFAGDDMTVCENEFIVVNGQTSGVESLLWTTSGDGIFGNPDEINTTYSPGPQDISTGMVEICLNVTAPGNCGTAQDCVVLTISQEPTVFAGDDAEICENETHQLNGSAGNYITISWESSGDGTFGNPDQLITTYTPGALDIQWGFAELCLMATASEGCEDAQSCLTLDIIKLPVVSTGEDMTVCENEVALLNQATALNYDSVEWTTTGDGTFDDPGIVNTTYTPGPIDIANTSVELTLVAQSLTPCSSSASSTMLITFEYLPVIIQNIEDLEVDTGGQIMLTILASDAGSFQWYGPQGMIPGADENVLIIPQAGPENQGEYYCEIGNDCGIILSNIITVTVHNIHILIIPEGWSGISSWIAPTDPAMENIFQDVEDDLIIMKNFDGIYSPGLNINTLVWWDPQSGYEVKFEEEVHVEFKGEANSNKTVELNNGWNYLPVISECTVDIEGLFGSMTEVDIIKDIAGTGIYWASLGINTIGELDPGKSYLLKANQNTSITYDDCLMKTSIIPSVRNIESPGDWNRLNLTPATHVVAIDEALISDFGQGDVLGAFTANGYCAGVFEIQDMNGAITLFANDPLTLDPDGFEENETIKFRLYKTASGEEFDVNVIFDPGYPNHSGQFTTNGISRILKADQNTLSVIDKSLENIQVFPNPTLGMLNITGLDEKATVEIYGTNGELIRQYKNLNPDPIQGNLSIDLSYVADGVVYVRIIDQNSVVIKKIIKN
nr:T9SS type A sorting domain-containing protein [Bacteroidota bacterium]